MKLSFFHASFLAIFIFLNTATFSGEKVASGIVHIQDNFRKFVNESAEIKEEEAKQQAIEAWKKDYKEVMGGKKSEILRRGPTKEEFNIVKMTLHNFVQKSVDADFEQLKQNYDAELLDGAKKRHLRALLILANAIKINKTEGDTYYTKNTAEAEKNQPIVTKTLEALEHMGFTQEQVDANSVNRILKHYNSPENGSLFYKKTASLLNRFVRPSRAVKIDTTEKLYGINKDGNISQQQGVYYLNKTDAKNQEYYKIQEDSGMEVKNPEVILKKIAYLIKNNTLGIPQNYFNADGTPNEKFLKITKMTAQNAGFTEAVYAVKVADLKSEGKFHLMYIVKIPDVREKEKEVKGLFWVSQLLPQLPHDTDWPMLKLHEAIFFDQDIDMPIIFLHASNGEPWANYMRETVSTNLPRSRLSKKNSTNFNDFTFPDFSEFLAPAKKKRPAKKSKPIQKDPLNFEDFVLPPLSAFTSGGSKSFLEATEVLLKRYTEESYKMAKTIGLIERKYVRGNWKIPMTLHTISFPDCHAGNIFYNEKLKQFSWIDLSSLGYSAHQYFSKRDYNNENPMRIQERTRAFPDFPMPLAGGLHQLIYLTFGRQPEDQKNKRVTTYSEAYGFRRIAFEAIIEGYLSAFEDLEGEQRNVVRNIVDNLVYVDRIRKDLDKYLPIQPISKELRHVYQNIIDETGYLKRINENMDYYFPVEK